MKFHLLIALAGVSLAYTASPRVFAAASPVTQVSQDVSSSFADMNPCTGVPGVSTITDTTVFHATPRPNGSVSEGGTNTGMITFAPTDPTQPTYTGHFSQSYGGSGRLDPSTGELIVGEETSTYAVRATASDGSVIAFHEVSHETVNPNGSVTVSFDRPAASCG